MERSRSHPRTGRAAAATLAAAGLWSSACEDTPTLIKIPEPAIHVDELKQKDAAKVDILWVIDNSGSMIEEQQALSTNFQSFITGLTLCPGTGMADDLCDFSTKKCSKTGGPCNPPNYHIGIITTDVKAATDSGRLRRVGKCVPSAGSMPAGGKLRYCGGADADCTGMATDPSYDPANRVCDMGGALAFIDPTTPSAAKAFERVVKVGTGGSGQESGIRAAAMALGRDADRATGQYRPAPTENKDFLRDDASLFIIFVTDEEDSSFGEVSYFYRAFESLKRAGNEGLVSCSAIVGDPDVDGEMGMMRGGCPKAPAIPTANPGMRYIALSMYSRGLSAEFRVCDGKRLTCPTESSCQSPVPNLPGVCVPSGACQADQDCGNFKCGDDVGCFKCENTKCSAKPEVFVELLSRNGIFGSLCEPDYKDVINALGFEAAGLRRKFELTKFPDCARLVPCGEGKEAPVCVRVKGEVIPNDRAHGWVYEPSSNGIFFDGDYVPPTAAPIEVSYRVSNAGAALSCTSALK